MDPHQKGGAAQLPIPQSAPLRDYVPCRERRIRFNHHGDCRERQLPNVGKA